MHPCVGRLREKTMVARQFMVGIISAGLYVNTVQLSRQGNGLGGLVFLTGANFTAASLLIFTSPLGRPMFFVNQLQIKTQLFYCLHPKYLPLLPYLGCCLVVFT